MEHPPQLNITQSEFKPIVADYFDNLLAQRDAILATYHLTPETAEEFCNLHTSDEDREKILALYERIVHVIEHKDIPQSETLVLEQIKEQHRINEFFGKDEDIKVPPLPPTITPERIQQWREKHLELRYLPPMFMHKNDDYPGWKEKPTQGINLFKNFINIELLAENCHNPSLKDLYPHQLTGRWMLADARPAKDFYSEQDNDHEIQSILDKLLVKGVIDNDGLPGRREYVPLHAFSNPEFWKPFYQYLGIGEDDHAVIRLPRLIEQNVLMQHIDTQAHEFEWTEEYYFNHARMYGCGEAIGSCTEEDWKESWYGAIGWRFVVVFSSD